MAIKRISVDSSIIDRKENQLPGEGPEKGVLTLPGEAERRFPDEGGPGFLTTTLETMVKWARSNSLWPFPFGTACCAIEFMSSVSSHYDMSRFGVRGRPLLAAPGRPDDRRRHDRRQDGSGPQEDLRPDARAAATSSRWGPARPVGGFYRAYHVVQGIDEIIPVDIWVPGCPPTPDGLIYGILKLKEKIERGEIRR